MGKPIQSIDRALSILELFNERTVEISLQEISVQLELSKSTIHGIIKTLETRHYLIQNPSNKKYRLGIRLFELGTMVGNNFNLKHIATPYIKNVFRAVDETVHLVAYEQNVAVYVEKEESNNSLRMYSQVGKIAPLYCTGVGKAIMAYLSKEEVERILDTTELKAFTSKTKIEKTSILNELALIQQRGYSIDDEEIEIGLFCIAAPIFNLEGNVVGSISTAGPKIRFDSKRTELAIQVIKESAENMSKELGYQPNLIYKSGKV